MNINSLVWVKSPEFKDAATDHLWLQSVVLEKQLSSSRESVAITVRIFGRDYIVKMPKNAVESDSLKLRDNQDVSNIEDIQYLKHINEPEVINLLRLRYERGQIFTYSGGVLVYLNPFDQIKVSPVAHSALEDFTRKILVTLANATDKGKSQSGIARSKSLYSMTSGVAKKIAHKASIIISGESGSGKSECYKMILNVLMEPTVTFDSASLEDLKVQSPGPLGSPLSASKSFMRTPSSLNRSRSATETELSPMALKDYVSAKHTEIVEKVLLCNRILESFGNARTLHTKDSSRFAKLVELVIRPKASPSRVSIRPRGGEVISATIKTYLLESSRTSTQQSKERNFNIFYELLAGWNSKERVQYGLVGTSTNYFYTNQGKLSSEEQRTLMQQDSEKFFQLNDSLLSMNFASEVITAIFQIVAGVLMMGEINFSETGDLLLSNEMLTVDNFQNPITTAARLFGVDDDAFKVLLTAKTLSTPNGDVIRLNLGPDQSRVARDGIAKQIYKNLFDYIVEKINAKLEFTSGDFSASGDNEQEVLESLRAVLILDIFGFDSFERNSIDQLCINYANEAMQQQFNTYIFKSEMDKYAEEGLDFDRLEFADNKDSLDLIANGIFRVLDDQCRLPHPTDKRFLGRIYKDFDAHPSFAVSKLQSGRNQFTILHFAGAVEYTADDFIEKNIDNTPPETAKTFATSQNEVLGDIFTQILTVEVAARQSEASSAYGAGAPQKRGSITNKGNVTLTSQFKNELQLLMKEIESTRAHYIRCIKPTEWEWSVAKTNRYWFSQAKISEQLKYCGIMEGFRFTKSKLSFLEFYNRYRVIATAVFNEPNLPYFLFDGTETGSKKGPKVFTADEIRSYCKELVDLFAIRSDTAAIASPNVRATIRPAVIDAKAPGYTNPLTLGRPSLKKSFSRTHSHNSSKALISSRIPSGLVNFDVDIFLASDGIINAKQVLLGNTKIFLPQQEHDYLEVCRTSCLSHLAQLIHDHYLKFICRRAFLAARRGAKAIQRRFRYHRMRIVRLRRQAAVVTMQRRFRRRCFMRSIARIQSLVRGYYARATLKYLREQKQQLIKAYGQFMVARDMRMQRRSVLTSIEDNVVNSMVMKQVAATPALTVDKIIAIPTLEARLAEYVYQEDSLNRAISTVKSDLTISLSSNSSDEDNDDSDPDENETNFKSLAKEKLQKQANSKNAEDVMGFSQLLQYWELCLQSLPDKYDASRANLSELKLKATRCYRLFQHAGKLLKPDALVDFSVIGKYMGLTVWKITALQPDRSIPPLTITKEHPLFENIHRILGKLTSIEELILDSLTDQPMKGKGKGAGGGDGKISRTSRAGKILEELLYACLEYKKYYLTYIFRFVGDYGDKSTFHQAFQNSPASYLFALLKIIKLEKKYDYSDRKEGGGGSGQQPKRASKVSNPLSFDWSNHAATFHARVSEGNKVLGYMATTGENQPRRLARVPGAQQSDTLRKLEEMEASRRLLNVNSLRIVEYNGFSYHFMPATPAGDYAVNAFRSFLIGEIPRVKKLFKVVGNRQNMGKIAYYAVTSNILSRTGAGKADNNHNHSLMDVIYDPVSIEQIDSLTFTSSVITCCIFGLLQLQPNHVMVNFERRTIGTANNPSERKEIASSLANQELRNIKLIGFNGDESVYQSFLQFKSPTFNKLHDKNVNVLFFLPHMDEPMDYRMRQFFLSSPFIAEELLINWLRDIYDQNQRYLELLFAAKRKQEKNHGYVRPQDFTEEDFSFLHLPGKIPKGSVLELLKRLKHISKFLRSTDPDMMPTPSLLFREFYPFLADFYEDIRLHSDFKENIEMDGVISYAYAYHHTVNLLRQKCPTIPASYYGESYASKYEDLRQLHNLRPLGGGSTVAMSTPRSLAHKISKLFKGRSPGGFNDQFWQNVQYVEDEDGHQLSDEEKRKRKKLPSSPTKGVKSPNGGPQTPGKANSVRFDFDDVYADAGDSRMVGQEKGVLKGKKSAYVDYGDVYDQESGIANSQSRSAVVVQGKSVSFNMGDVYEKPPSFFDAPESLFIVDNLPARGKIISPVVNYGDVYEHQSDFSMSDIIRSPGGGLTTGSADGPIRTPQGVRTKKQVSAGSFDFYDVYEENAPEAELLEDIPSGMMNHSARGSNDSANPSQLKLDFDFAAQERQYGHHREDEVDEGHGRNANVPFIPLKDRRAQNGLSPNPHVQRPDEKEAMGDGRKVTRRKSLTNRPHSQLNNGTQRGDTRERQMFLQNNEVPAMARATPQKGAPASPPSSPTAPSEVEYATVFEEINDFIQSLDFRFLRESFAKVAHEYDRIDYSLRLCKMIGRNFSFLPTITLLNINEMQLKVMFKSFIRGNINRKNPQSYEGIMTTTSPTNKNNAATPTTPNKKVNGLGISLQTKELILRFDNKEEMYQVQKSSVLYYLKKDYNMEIKLRTINDADLVQLGAPSHESHVSPDPTAKNVRKSITKDSNGDDMLEMGVNPLAKRRGTKRESELEESIMIHYDVDGMKSPNQPMFNTPNGGVQRTFSTSSEGTTLDRRDSIENVLSYDEQERRFTMGKANNHATTAQAEMTEEEYAALKEQLLKILMTSTNMMMSNNSNFEALKEARNKIEAVKKVIHYIVTPSLHRFQPIDNRLLSGFEVILLEYPGLAPIASLLVERNAFIHNLLFVSKLIEHKQMDRFVDLITKIIWKHPDALILADSQGYLPCDRIKAITPQEHQKYSIKYPLLTKIVNFAGEMNQRYLQSTHRGGLGYGIFTRYHEEEELIVLATHLDFSATEEELMTGFYDLTKKDRFGISMMLKTIIKELFGLSAEEKQLALTVFEMVMKSVECRKRMGTSIISPRNQIMTSTASTVEEKEMEMIMGCISLSSDEISPLINNIDWKYNKAITLQDSTIYQRLSQSYSAKVISRIDSYFELILTISG